MQHHRGTYGPAARVRPQPDRRRPDQRAGINIFINRWIDR